MGGEGVKRGGRAAVQAARRPEPGGSVRCGAGGIGKAEGECWFIAGPCSCALGNALAAVVAAASAVDAAASASAAASAAASGCADAHCATRRVRNASSPRARRINSEESVPLVAMASKRAAARAVPSPLCASPSPRPRPLPGAPPFGLAGP